MPRRAGQGVTGFAWRVALPEEAPPIPGLDAPPFIGRLLRMRGIDSSDAAAAFLEPERQQPAKTRGLRGFPEAVERAAAAVEAGEQVAVYGDYDVDGITSTAILVEALRERGADCRWFVPHREADGYGVHADALERLGDEGARLIITADCGITARTPIAAARERGIDVVVLDHHQPDGELPDAIVAAPTRAAPDHPLREVSAGGLAWHFAHALGARLGAEARPRRWLELAALSTVADVVPLRGENRRIVTQGLRELARTQRPGLRALLEAAGARNGRIDAETIGFQIAPRLNAAGRLDDAALAVRALLETDRSRANALARQLDRLNARRRQLSDAAWLRAREQVERTRAMYEEVPALVWAGDEETPPGIVGIVAGRLADRYQRPAFAYAVRSGLAQASARSRAGFDFAAALADCADLLVHHGGHAMAAGFTIETSNLEPLCERLNALAESAIFDRADAPAEPLLEIDAQVPLDRVTGETAKWISKLAPFGAGNPAPVFLSVDVPVSEVRRFGRNSKPHLGLRIGTWNAVGWQMGGSASAAERTPRIDVVWSFRRNQSGELELELKDFRPAGPRAPMPPKRAALKYTEGINLCVCGCRVKTGRYFAPGHDMWLSSWLEYDNGSKTTIPLTRVDWCRLPLTFWGGRFRKKIEEHRAARGCSEEERT